MDRNHHTHLNRLCELVGHGSLFHGGHQSLGSEDLRVNCPSISHWRKGNELGEKGWRCEDGVHGKVLRLHTLGERLDRHHGDSQRLVEVQFRIIGHHGDALLLIVRIRQLGVRKTTISLQSPNSRWCTPIWGALSSRRL